MTLPTEAPRSCAECPSCLSPERIRDLYQSNYGAETDLCAPFGHVLSVPGLTSVNVQIKRKFASNCEYYGQDRSALAIPVASVSVPTTFHEDTEMPLSSCLNCVNFIPADVVHRELGWMTPMCGAQGRLMLMSKLMEEPQHCGTAAYGAPQTTTMMVRVLPDYDPDAVVLHVDPSKAVSIVAEAFVEPLEYVSDRPIDDDDREAGIVAWRKLLHPKYGDRKTPLWLPIFGPDAFTEAEQMMIPQTGGEGHPELYVDHQHLIYKVVVAMIGLDKCPVLTGEAGTGKTELFRHLAWLCQMPFVRMSFNKNKEGEDVIGKWLFTEGATNWSDGRLTAAYRRPCVIVIDEWNTAPDALLQSLRPLTDNSKQLVLDEAQGEVVARNDWCLMGFAQNPSWDLKYVGTNQLSNADEERCMWVAVDMPSEEIERAIIVRWCLSNGYDIEAKTLDAIMEIAKDIRQLTDPKAPSLSFSWGIRPQIAVAQNTQYLSLMESYKMVVLDRVDPNQASTVRNFVTRFDS